MNCDKGFSNNYMVLDLDAVGIWDLFHILFSKDLEKRKFVDSTEGREESFRRRWLIFFSIVVQKLLLLVAKPLAFVGSTVEMLLNVLSSNTNLVTLVLNFLRGKTAMPDKSSSNYLSFVGNSDKRIALDESIKPNEGSRYFAALSIMASKAAYENRAYIRTVVEDHWKMEYLGFYDYWNEYQEKATTQAFLLYDKKEHQDTVVVSFRGTETFDSDAWCSDFDITWYELVGIGRIHGGFMKALGLQCSAGWPKVLPENPKRTSPVAYYHIRDKLKKLIEKNQRLRFILTGHSQGGSLAAIFPAILLMHGETSLLERLEGIYTFGQPRVGDRAFGEFMEKNLKKHKVKYIRFVYSNDIVPRMPYDDKDLTFKHFGTCIYYNRKYIGKVVPEEPNKNYLSPFGAPHMMFNAALELIRSFTIPYTKGPEYQEGWFMTLIRITGIVTPGIANHFLTDYVNSTRLGSPGVYDLVQA